MYSSKNQDYQSSLNIQCMEFENDRNILLAQQLHDAINGHEKDPMLVQHLALLDYQLAQIDQHRQDVIWPHISIKKDTEHLEQDRELAVHLYGMEKRGMASGIVDRISSEDLEKRAEAGGGKVPAMEQKQVVENPRRTRKDTCTIS